MGYDSGDASEDSRDDGMPILHFRNGFLTVHYVSPQADCMICAILCDREFYCECVCRIPKFFFCLFFGSKIPKLKTQ